MLNDISRQTRISTFFQLFGPGVMIGSNWAIGTAQDGLVVMLLVLGLVLTLSWSVGWITWLRLADRRLKALLLQSSEEITSGRVTGIRAVGQVVRSRAARASPAFLAGTPHPLPAPSLIVVVTALADEGARRVGALVPVLPGLRSRGAPVTLLLHPSEREVAVLDPDVSPEQLAAGAGDPRWRSVRLPTDRSVVGGWLPVLVIAGVGLAAGISLDLVVVALAT